MCYSGVPLKVCVKVRPRLPDYHSEAIIYLIQRFGVRIFPPQLESAVKIFNYYCRLLRHFSTVQSPCCMRLQGQTL